MKKALHLYRNYTTEFLPRQLANKLTPHVNATFAIFSAKIEPTCLRQVRTLENTVNHLEIISIVRFVFLLVDFAR